MSHYDDKGKEIVVDTFPKGSGKYALYFPNGKVCEQSNYVNGSLNGSCKTFYFDGSLESTMFIKPEI